MTFADDRARLVEVLRRQAIVDERVLEVMGRVPREEFVPEALRSRAYDDTALPIDAEQTISQPYIVARMTEALELTGDEKVLEIGTGSGYQAAVLAELCGQLVTIERIESLSRSARAVLERIGYTNIEFFVGDGTLGVPEHEPYDGIVATAMSEKLPPQLYEQLAPGGRLIIPIGDEALQQLTLFTKTERGSEIETLGGCRFVKLVGQAGWSR